MPPPTKKRKENKKDKKKPSAQPPKKERKKARKKDALAVGGRIGQIVRLPLLLTKNKFIHSFIPPYKFGFVGDKKCVAANK
jgi:hypothetical protein